MSFQYAFEGIAFALARDQNLRIHVVVGFIALLLGFLLQISFIEMAILTITIVVVLVSEMINSAIEQVVDLIVNEHRKEAKFAKDVSAAMVLTAAVGSIFVGIFIFIPHLVELLV